jgi:hypothetical protein
MKFVLSYTVRTGGSIEERVTAGEAAQKLLTNWAPSDKATIREWVQRCDGNGGFAIVEQDDPAELYRDLGTWSPWLEFQAFPVVDIGDTNAIQQEVLQKARSVL